MPIFRSFILPDFVRWLILDGFCKAVKKRAQIKIFSEVCIPIYKNSF